MPRWDLHLACGISVAILYGFCATFPLLGTGSWPVPKHMAAVSLPLFIGAFSLLLGSLLPDIDGKGRVRWIIGPVIGTFALTLMALRAYLTGGIGGTLSYLSDDGALLFLAGTALGYGLLLLPMRHRGIMHGAPAAIAFSLICSAAFIAILDPDPERGAMVGAMAFSGYGWHLALDGSV